MEDGKRERKEGRDNNDDDKDNDTDGNGSRGGASSRDRGEESLRSWMPS